MKRDVQENSNAKGLDMNLVLSEYEKQANYLARELVYLKAYISQLELQLQNNDDMIDRIEE